MLATLRKGEHAVTLEKRAVHGVIDAWGGAVAIGEELILSLNAHWRRMRVFKSDGSPLDAATVETIAKLEARGWR